MARSALERQGWECATARTSEERPVSTLVFTVPIRSGGFGASATLAQELTVALADARVRGVHHYVVDPAHPGYASLPVWRARPAPSSQADGEDRAGWSSRSTKRAPVQARAFGAPEAVNGGAALGRTIGQPDLDAECVGTLTDRLHRAVVALRRAVEEDVARVVVATAAIVGTTSSFLLTQWAATRQAPDDAEFFLWWYAPMVGFALVAGILLTSAAAALAKVTGDRLGRTPQFLARIVGAATFGVLVGGYARQDLSLGTLAGLAGFATIGALWRLAGRAKRRIVAAALRVTVLVGAMTAFGRLRMVVYYGGMGVPASEVDVTNVDSLTIGAVPVMKALLALGFLLAIAWVVSGWYLQLMGAVLTVLGLLAAASLLLGTLQTDQIRGRQVGAGVAETARGGVRGDPVPTQKCVASITGPSPLTPRLPRLVWRIGVFGPQTLLLDPVDARALFEARHPELTERQTYVRHQDVHAPVWYVPTGQLTFLQGDDCAALGLLSPS